MFQYLSSTISLTRITQNVWAFSVYYLLYKIPITTASEDYSSTTEEVTFSAKETVKYVTVPITTDNVLEGAEQFIATLSPVDGSIDVQIRQGNATATIVDDDSKSQEHCI